MGGGAGGAVLCIHAAPQLLCCFLGANGVNHKGGEAKGDHGESNTILLPCHIQFVGENALPLSRLRRFHDSCEWRRGCILGVKFVVRVLAFGFGLDRMR